MQDRQTGHYFAAAGDGIPTGDGLLGGDEAECDDLYGALAWAHLPAPAAGRPTTAP